VRLLDIDQLSGWLDALLAYVPRFLLGLLIIDAGTVLGTLARNLSASVAKQGDADALLPRLTQVGVVVIAVVTWKYMFEPDVGVISGLLALFNLPELAWTTDRWAALTLVALLSIWLHLPFSFLILYSALLGVPRELFESAAIDGASAWQRFRRITVPMLMPAILVALMFRYVFAFRLFAEVWLLTGGGPARQTEVLATYLYRHAFRYQEVGVASAIGWLMVIATLLIAAIYLHQMYKRMLAAHA